MLRIHQLLSHAINMTASCLKVVPNSDKLHHSHSLNTSAIYYHPCHLTVPVNSALSVTSFTRHIAILSLISTPSSGKSASGAKHHQSASVTLATLPLNALTTHSLSSCFSHSPSYTKPFKCQSKSCLSPSNLTFDLSVPCHFIPVNPTSPFVLTTSATLSVSPTALVHLNTSPRLHAGTCASFDTAFGSHLVRDIAHRGHHQLYCDGTTLSAGKYHPHVSTPPRLDGNTSLFD